MIRIFWIFALVSSFGISISFGQKPCVPKKHARLPAITELTYITARKRLLAAGWQPLQTVFHMEADKDPNIAYGNGQIFWNRGFWEVESCSGTGLAACSFLFSDAYVNKLRVTTLGEELPKQKAHARVSHYEFECGKIRNQ